MASCNPIQISQNGAGKSADEALVTGDLIVGQMVPSLFLGIQSRVPEEKEEGDLWEVVPD